MYNDIVVKLGKHHKLAKCLHGRMGFLVTVYSLRGFPWEG